MALTQEESAALMNDPVFRGRVKVCALNYAQYLSLQAATAGSNAKMTWMQSTVRNPDNMAATLTPPTVLNPNVQIAGAEVTDADLMAAVQAVADMIM